MTWYDTVKINIYVYVAIKVKCMLKIIHSMKHLRFSELIQVYHETNICNGKEFYPNLTELEQIRNAEDDFYQYLQSVFFKQDDSYYAVWEEEGCYLSALRIEPYSDGLLLCGLETIPTVRHRGYASSLILAVQTYLQQQGSGRIYSHISKRNIPSLAVHKKYGFQIVKDHAVYSDGSVAYNSYTMLYEYEKSET